METYSEMALSTLPISLLCSTQTTTKRRGKVTGPLLLRVAFSFKKCLAYVLYRPNAVRQPRLCVRRRRLLPQKLCIASDNNKSYFTTQCVLCLFLLVVCRSIFLQTVQLLCLVYCAETNKSKKFDLFYFVIGPLVRYSVLFAWSSVYSGQMYSLSGMSIFYEGQVVYG